jgi:serine/threonine protein kinase
MLARSMSGAPAEVGSTANHYGILARLAVGGMAEIFLARGTSATGVERYCVLKRILRDRATDTQFVQMFLDEARLAAQLNHSNIAQVYDIGKLGDSYFFTMEYVHGETAREVQQRARTRGRELPLGMVLTVIAGVAAGLHHAHERRGRDGRPLGIVHRDVSPSNLMLGYEGGVKIVDFGVAKAADRTQETRAGTVKGKISYLSPEQCCGAPVDRRTDLFALGIVMWELVTGERLYRRASDFENMSAIVNEAPRPPSAVRRGVPPEIDEIALRLLAKDPAARFTTADQVVEAVEAAAVATGAVISSSSVGRMVRELFGERPEPWLELDGPLTDAARGAERVTVTSEPVPRELTAPLDDEVDHKLAAVPDLPSALTLASDAWGELASDPEPSLDAPDDGEPEPAAARSSAPGAEPSGPSPVAPPRAEPPASPLPPPPRRRLALALAATEQIQLPLPPPPVTQPEIHPGRSQRWALAEGAAPEVVPRASASHDAPEGSDPAALRTLSTGSRPVPAISAAASLGELRVSAAAALVDLGPAEPAPPPRGRGRAIAAVIALAAIAGAAAVWLGAREGAHGGAPPPLPATASASPTPGAPSRPIVTPIPELRAEPAAPAVAPGADRGGVFGASPGGSAGGSAGATIDDPAAAVQRAIAERRFGDARRSCASRGVAAKIPALCVQAACAMGDLRSARSWLRSVPASARAGVAQRCGPAGAALAVPSARPSESGAADCDRDPMACPD